MPKIIDHEQRRIDILRQAFRLFARHGYQNTSLSHLAVACDISRPTLYLYFKDKEEIFTYAIKYYTDEMFSGYLKIASEKGPVVPKLRKILADLVIKSWLNRDFITSLGDFIFQKRVENRNFPEEVRRRTLKFEYLLKRLIRKAVANGELRNIPADITSLHIIDLIEAYLFKLAVINMASPKHTISLIESFLESLKASEC
jgi:AcrR family transcriptional regulator